MVSEYFPKTAVSLQAHPDDAEAWCAGALFFLKRLGYRIVIATYTDGNLGGVGANRHRTAAVRREEAGRAAELLDAEYISLGHDDGFLIDSRELRIEAISLLRRIRAGIVFTPSPIDYHPDHRAAGNITESACLLTTLENAPSDEKPLENTPLLYHTALMRNRDGFGQFHPPHFYLDVTRLIDEKMKMLECHRSQIELMRVMHKIDDFFAEAKRYNAELGDLCGVTYAESFWQHLGGGFPTEHFLQNLLREHVLEDNTPLF